MSSRRRNFKATPTAEEYRQRRQDRYMAIRRERRQALLDQRRRIPEFRELGMLAETWENFAANQRQARQQELAAMQNPGGGMRANEGRLAEYLYDRRMLNRTIEGPELDRLRNANQSVEETRRRLSSGRGNVAGDINRDGLQYESTRRTEIGRAMVNRMQAHEGPMSNSRFGQLSASAAEFTRAGNCGEHANVATHVHANQLGIGETVHSVGSNQTDHAWSELRSGHDRSSDVIMDAWSNSSAILREDASFAGNVAHVDTSYSYNQAQGVFASNQQRQHYNALDADPGAHQFADNVHQQMVNQNFHYTNGVYGTTHASTQDFRRSANAAHNRQNQQNGFLHGIVAAGVARSLGENVRQATTRANRVMPRGIGTNWE
ncbi:MAG: hypothetical protein ACPG4N_02770 [Gammaproteobacteria bacterium]